MGREKLVREVMTSSLERRRAAAAAVSRRNKSASTMTAPPILEAAPPIPPTATATAPPILSLLPVVSNAAVVPTCPRTTAVASTGGAIPSCIDAGVPDNNDEIQYIKTVYPVDVNNNTGKAPLHAPQRPHPTKQLKMDDFFDYKKLKFANIPPSLLAALAKSEAYSKGLLVDLARLKKDVAELWGLKGEADALFEELQERFKPLIEARAGTSAALPLDPAGASIPNQSADELSDEQYLAHRSAVRVGKSRATQPPSLKRRASSTSAPSAKKLRAEA